MSFLNLKRLLPDRKLWKVLTNKLPLKLIGSEVNKEQKHRSYKTSKKFSMPSLSIQPKKFKKQIHHKNHHCYSQRRLPPVFIDHLFVQPISIVKEHLISPGQTSKPKLDSSGSSLNNSENLDQETNDEESDWPESGNEETIDNADDLWESMVLNSPQMDGIDERADEFIARFRNEMRQQEILARRL